MTSSSSTVHSQGQVQADLHSVLTTLVVFAIISMSVYYFLLKPILSLGGGDRPVDGNTTRAAAPTSRHIVTPQQRMAFNNNNIMSINADSEVLALLTQNTTCPPHVASTKHAGIGGSNILVDGLVPFRHGRAVSYEQKDDVAKNRRERAKVLANAIQSSSPPSRASTVVVSVSSSELDCPKLRRVLFLLATMYNLFVILSFDKDVEDAVLEKAIAKLRGPNDPVSSELPTEVLPDHRIVAAHSVMGRVAFVRQLARVELVLDYDSEVETQLSRFGFNVLVYGKDVKGGNDDKTSLLGKSLLS